MGGVVRVGEIACGRSGDKASTLDLTLVARDRAAYDLLERAVTVGRAQAELALAQNATQLARLATVDQERLIEGTRQLLISLSQSRDVQEGNAERCKAYLQQLLSQFGATYNNLGVSDVH